MGGGQGGTCAATMMSFPMYRCVHLLIVHLNSFHLLCEMNGYAIYSPNHFTQKMKGIEMDYQ